MKGAKGPHKVQIHQHVIVQPAAKRAMLTGADLPARAVHILSAKLVRTPDMHALHATWQGTVPVNTCQRGGASPAALPSIPDKGQVRELFLYGLGRGMMGLRPSWPCENLKMGEYGAL